MGLIDWLMPLSLASLLCIYTVLVPILLSCQRGQLWSYHLVWFYWFLQFLLYCPLTSWWFAAITSMICLFCKCFPFWCPWPGSWRIDFPLFVVICISNFPFSSQVLGNQVSILIFFYPLFSFDRLTMHSSKWFPFLVSSTWSCPPCKELQNSTINTMNCNVAVKYPTLAR